MAESLTMNLRMELEKTNLQFQRWASTQKDWLDTTDANYHHKLEEFNVTINALKENDSQLEASQTINESIKRQQMIEMEQCEAQNSLLHKQKDVLEHQMRRCEEEEERESRRLDEARAEHEILRQKNGTDSQ
mmetsp:Transcript_5033/g.8198  ORF Transcript_5033/g.8198 Transcript_5033/m.8198 type:complete len:132 (+) Transcript_5033:37-432(+)